MKQILILCLCSMITVLTKAQTISPALTNEYCPNTEYTFTATILKTYQSMLAVNGSTITQLPNQPVGSTFTFKGRFGDVNQKQIFRIFSQQRLPIDKDEVFAAR